MVAESLSTIPLDGCFQPSLVWGSSDNPGPKSSYTPPPPLAAGGPGLKAGYGPRAPSGDHWWCSQKPDLGNRLAWHSLQTQALLCPVLGNTQSPSLGHLRNPSPAESEAL